MLVMDDIDDIDEPQGSYLCPSCGVMPDIQGATSGCTDPDGCGTTLEALDDEEDAYSEDYEDEDDMGLEELDF